MLEIKAYCFSNNEREACHCYEPCWGLNGAVLPFSEGISARSQAPGQVHLGLGCSRQVKCSARCYFPVSPLQPRAQFYPWLPQQSSSPWLHRLQRTIKQLPTVVISSLVPKGYLYLGFLLFIFGRFFFFFSLFWFPIYVITRR